MNKSVRIFQKLIFVASFVFFVAAGANAQHYIGVKNAYGLMDVSISPSPKDKKGINTVFNPGIAYRYEHKKYFAFQTELNYISKGYEALDTTFNIYSLELPIMGQAFYRFGWFRPYVTGGAFVGYVNKRNIEVGGETKKFRTDTYTNRFEYGIIGGAGMGFTISRFELQSEWRYQYCFSFLREPHINGITRYLNSTQMTISLALFYRFGG